MFKLIDENQYQGHTYKLITEKVSRMPGHGFGTTIEIDGVKQKMDLATKANAYVAHREGIVYAKNIIRNFPRM